LLVEKRKFVVFHVRRSHALGVGRIMGLSIMFDKLFRGARIVPIRSVSLYCRIRIYRTLHFIEAPPTFMRCELRTTRAPGQLAPVLPTGASAIGPIPLRGDNRHLLAQRGFTAIVHRRHGDLNRRA
jgi:hypothetical protein